MREAKAVRDSRKLLAQENREATQAAWSLLQPFLAENPRHLQARFLCGKATIRLGLRDEAKQCLAVVGERSPELAEELGKDYRQVLTLQTRTQGCNDASTFEQSLAWAEGLGVPYAESVFEGLDGVAEACRVNNYGPSQFIAVLAKRDQAMKMVDKGYVPAISRALAQAKYDDAYGLVQHAVYFVPAGEPRIKEVMDSERRKVSVTVGSLRQLCERFKTDTRYRTGNSWCYPVAAPPAVYTVKDGWGGAVLYSPIEPDETQRCHQGFALTSLGGDGAETENGRGNPADEIVCRFVYGQESWQLPHPYWLISNDH